MHIYQHNHNTTDITHNTSNTNTSIHTDHTSDRRGRCAGEPRQGGGEPRADDVLRLDLRAKYHTPEVTKYTFHLKIPWNIIH